MGNNLNVEESIFIGILSEQGATEVKLVKTEDETLFFVKGLDENELFEASGELIGLTDEDFETYSLDTEEGREVFSQNTNLGVIEHA